jgi:surface protein
MGTRAANVLRAVVAGTREAGDKRQIRARLQRAWDGLSTAEKIALGGTLAAAIAGGGLMLRAGLNAMTRPLSIAEMRAMTTKDLLRSFERGNESQKAAIARFCFCRVHDVRDILFGSDAELEILALEILTRVGELLDPANPAGSDNSAAAKKEFIQDALAMRFEEGPGLGTKYPQIWAEAKEFVEGSMKKTEEAIYASHGTQEEKTRYEALLEKRIKLRILYTKKIQKRNDLVTAIRALGSNGTNGYHPTYGHIACWDVREVTSMKLAFKSMTFGRTLGVLDLSFWDTSNVTDMSEMFHGYQGNVEVGMWDTRKVTDMGGMFENAGDFNGDIGNWDTGKVENMAGMFLKASKFNGAIGSWNTSKVKHAGVMFYYATAFNQDLSAWNLGSVERFELMFTASGIDKDEPKKPKKVRLAAPQDMRSPGLTEMVFGRASPRAYV